MLGVLACASAVPTFAGGSKTPRHRTDVGVGGAARVPFGDLNEGVLGDAYRERVEAGGVVPTAYVRRGLTERFDLGVMVTGTDLRLEFRGEKVLSPEPTTRASLVYALAPYGGWIPDNNQSGSGGRVGFDLPVVYGIDFNGVYELWFGPRLTHEYVFGDFMLAGQSRAASAHAFRAGGVLGMALGFRRLHALIELTAGWEQWLGNHGGARINRGGVALIPAFAIRLRI